MTEGELAGAHVRRVGQIRIRPDGSVALDIRETIETDRAALGGRPRLRRSRSRPNVHEIRGFALCSTGAHEYAAHDTAVAAINGTVEMATRELVITSRAVTSEAHSDPVQAAARSDRPGRPCACTAGTRWCVAPMARRSTVRHAGR